MLRTLFTIPYEVGDVPIFGFGILLAIWAVFSVVLMALMIRRHGFDRNVAGYIPMLLVVGALIVLLPNVFTDGLPIHGYGVMMLLGVVSGVLLAIYQADRMGIHPDLMMSLGFTMFVSGIIGARAFYVIQYWETFKPERLNNGEVGSFLADITIGAAQGGLVVYGSFIAAGIAVSIFLYIHRDRMPSLATVDLLAPAMMIGLAFGRLGCLFNGCCFGGACELPWAVTFPAGSPPYEHQLNNGTLQLDGILFDALEQGANSSPVIAQIDPDSAAARAGLKKGDLIVAISGKQRNLADSDAKKKDGVEVLSGWTKTSVKNVLQAQRALLSYSAAGERITVYVQSDSVGSSGEIRSIHLTPGEPPPRSTSIHPSQIYSSMNAGLLCAFLLAYYPYRRRDGEMIALLLTLYPIARFTLEFIRRDEVGQFSTGLTISQLVSVGLLIVAAGLWIYLSRRPRGSSLPMQRSGNPIPA